MMAGPRGIYSFVTKFLNLLQSCENARLEMKCQAGKAQVIDLIDPNSHVHHPQQERPRCAKAREEAAGNAADTLHDEPALQPVPPTRLSESKLLIRSTQYGNNGSIISQKCWYD